MPSPKLLTVAYALVLAALTAPRPAAAYCRTSTCGEAGTGHVCVPAQSNDCGIPLAWPTSCVTYSLQEDASANTSLETVTAVTGRAFATWADAACPGGGSPRIKPVDAGPVACDKHEYNQQAGNANILLFRDEEWPHAGIGDALALTTVTYNVDNGEIYDADIELNSAEATFSTADVGASFDLESVITHEAGHFLGLSHSTNTQSTMYPDYTPGSISLRTLNYDDIDGICAIYPPGAPIPSSCDPTPRHGFSAQCASDQEPLPPPPPEGGCCGVAPGSPGHDGGAAVIVGIACLGLANARRKARR